MNKILLFIPCFNCEKQIIRVLNSLNEEVFKLIDEIIIIDNRSTDNTQKVVKKFILDYNKKNFMKLILNDENYSFGGSHKVAINYAREKKFSHILVLHGDDQANILDLLRQNIEKKSSVDCFMGSRFLKDSEAKTYSKLKKIGNLFFNYIFSLFSKKKIYDLGSGLYLIKVSVFADEQYINFPNNLTFNYYLTLYMAFKNYNLEYFPISWREEDQVSNVKILKQTFQLLQILFIYIFNTSKLFEKKNEKSNFGYKILDL